MPYIIGAVGGGDGSNGFIDVEVLPPIADARPNTTYLRTTDLSLHYTKFEVTAAAIPTAWTETDIDDSHIVNTFFSLNVNYRSPSDTDYGNPPTGQVNLWFSPVRDAFLIHRAGHTNFDLVLTPPDVFDLPAGSTIHWIGNLDRSGSIIVEPDSRNVDTLSELRAWMDAHPAAVADINADPDQWYIAYTGGELFRITAVVPRTPETFNFNYELLGILALGPEQNEFTGTTQTIAETARDTYATANSTWLDFYNLNRNRFIEIEFGTTRVFQARDSAMTGWDDIQGFARGATGPAGSFTGVTLSGTDLTFMQSSGSDITLDVAPLIAGLGNGTVYFLTSPVQNSTIFSFDVPADYEPIVTGDIIAFTLTSVAPSGGSVNIRIDSQSYLIRGRDGGSLTVDNLQPNATYVAILNSNRQFGLIGPYPGITAAEALALIATWARASSPTGTVPDALIPSGITRDTELSTAIADFLDQSAIEALFATWARASPSGQIPDGLISADITRDAELAAAIVDFLDQTQTDARIALALAAAVTGNTENDIDVTYNSGTGKLNFDVQSEGLVSIDWQPAARQASFLLVNGANLILNLGTLAPIANPAFQGSPTASTPPAGDDSTRLATTSFVATAVQAVIALSADGVLQSADLSGNDLELTLSTGTVITVDLGGLLSGLITAVTANEGLEGGGTAGDVTVGIVDGGVTLPKIAQAAIDSILSSPALTGVPTAPTAPGGDSTDRLATTRFVENVAAGFITAVHAGVGLDGGGTSGDVTLGLATGGIEYLHFSTAALLALFDNTLLTGMPTAPTAVAHTRTTQVATTAFVEESTDNLQTQTQVEHLIQNAIRDAVTGNLETGLTVTYQTGGTLDFVLDAMGVRDALHLSVTEVNTLVTGLALAGTALTISYNNQADQTITLPAGGMGGTGDGVLQSAALDSTTHIATFTLTTGGTVTLDLSPLAGAQAVATDATVDGDGTAGDPLSIASYAGGAIASLAVNYVAQAFDVTHLDGTTASVSFTDIPAFRGVGGDTFTGASTFAFGDSAIVDSILYIYTDTSPSDYTPATIGASNRFRHVPILDATGLLATEQIATGGAAGQLLTRTATGQEWATPVGVGTLTGLTANEGLEGGGTSGNIIVGIVDEGVTEAKLDATNVPADAQVLSFDAGSSRFEWIVPPAGYSDADVDARLLNRLQNAPQSGASFFDRLLMWDDANPNELRSFDMGGIRLYTTVNWAQPTNTAVLPVAKIASGGTANQVLGWTASGQEWVDQTGMGTVASDGTLSGTGVSGDPLGVADDSITTLQLADDVVTEPKLAASNAPGTSQVLSWDGSALTWADQTGMGGGLLTVATDTSFGGDGTSGDPLTLDAVPARSALGLGTAATRDVGSGSGNLVILQTDNSFLAEHLAPSGSTGQVLTRTGTGKEWATLAGASNDYVEDATLALSGRNLSITLGRTGSLSDVSSNTVTLPGGGLTFVAHNDSITGLGSLVSPLGLNANGTTFPIIPVVKGGTGAIDAASARTNLGVPIGTADGELVLLSAGGVFDTGRLAPAGTADQVLTRTAVGMEWEDAGAGAFTFNRLGTYTFPGQLSAAQDNFLYDSGITAPDDTSKVYRIYVGENAGRRGAALFRGSELHEGTTVAAPVWVNDTTVGILETLGNSRQIPFGSNRGAFVGITDGGNIAIGVTHEDVIPFITLEEVFGGGSGGGLSTVATDATITGDGSPGDPLGVAAGGGQSDITDEEEFTFGGLWTNLQVRATSIQVPADARFIMAFMQLTGAHSSATDLPYTSTQIFDADLFRAFTAISVGDNPRGIDGNFFGGDVGGPPNDQLFAKVTSGSNEVIGIAATTATQSHVLSIRVRFITDLSSAPNTDDYVSTAALALSGTDISLTLGRTGGLADVISNALTLPSGGGAGDITAVTTATGSGLGGGVTTGAADLVLDIEGLTNQPSPTLADNDILFLGDVSDAADPRKHLTIGGLFSFAAAGESTIASGGGRLRVADDGITETQIATTATPATGEILGWSGTELEWVAQNAGGTGGTGRYFAINRAGVTGNGTQILLETGQSLTALQSGDRFMFRMKASPTGLMSIAVDGLAAVILVRGQQGSLEAQASVGDAFINNGLIVTYVDTEGFGQNRFWLSYTSLGNAAKRTAGTAANNVPFLNADARLPQSTLGGTTVSDGDLLTATGGSQRWISPARNGGLRAGTPAIMNPIAINSTVNVEHGLGREPDFINAFLECLTADLGYAPGDRVSAFNYNRSVSGGDDLDVWVSTEVSTLPYIVNKAGGDDLQIQATSWEFIAVPYIVEGSSPTRFVYTIPDADVGGTANAITLSTGDSLANVPRGTFIFFRANLSNTGDTTVDVDGIGPSHIAIGGAGGIPALLAANDIVSTEQYTLIKDFNDTYTIRPLQLSRGAWNDVGTTEYTLAVLGAGGVFGAERLATGGAAGQVLARTGTGAEWANSPTQSRWVIEDANVGGTNNALTLTTGDSLTVIPEGADFVFTSLASPNTGPVTVDIDGTGAAEIRSGAGGGGSHRPLRAGEIAAREDYIINFAGFDYGIRASLLGIAGNFDVGLNNGNLVSLINEDGVGEQLPVSTFAPGGVAGTVLTRTQDGKRWMAPTGGAGDTFYYTIPDADVGGTANAITLTSGSSLSAYANGQRFFFTANSTNTGALTVSVDGIAGISVQWSNGFGGSEALSGGEVTADDPITLVYGSDDNAFYLLPSLIGGAARRNVGDAEHNVPVLQADASLIASHIAPAGTTGQVLTRTGTGKEWADATGMSGGLLTVATDTAFGGDGTSGDPLTLAVAGVDFPVISLAKGGTGATDAAAARLAFGLGSAATRDAGDQQFNVGVLQSDGAFSFGRLAPGGTTGQVLTRTGTGKEWADATGMSGGLLTVSSDATLSGDGTSGDPLGVADDSITTVQLADEAVRTANFGLLSVHAAQLAADAVTEPKLAASNTPGTSQVLSWDGSALTWVAQTGGGGTGDITAVTTATGSGLSGGVDTGAANLVLEIAGLTNQSSTGLNDSDIFLLGDVSDSSDPRKHLTVGSLFGFAANGEATIESSGGKIRVPAGGITAQEIADNTVTEPKLQVANVPGADNLMSWDGSGMRWIPAFDLLSLPGLGTVVTGDLMAVSDTSDGGRTKRASVLNVMSAFVATSPTLEVSSSQLTISAGAITEPLLAITGTPTTGQAIFWNGSGMEWDAAGGIINNFVDAATLALSGNDLTLTLGRDGLGDVVSNVLTLPAGGAGDITAVAVGVGLTGGGTSGDVTIGLDLNSLPTIPAVTGLDRVVVIDRSDSNIEKDIAAADFASEITPLLRLARAPLESQIDASDNFVYSDTSNLDNIRRVTWGGAIARAADQVTLTTANARMMVANGGVGTDQLADGAATEPKLAITGTPVTGQVIAWDGSAMEWATPAGAGDITGVAAGTGLSGGGTAGDVTLGLNVSGLHLLFTNDITAADAIVIDDDSDANNPARITLAAFAAHITNGSSTVDDSNGQIMVANGGVGATQIATDAVTQGKVADEAIDEPRMDISNAPISGYVLAWNGTEMEWRAEGGMPTPTHTSYAVTGADETFTATEFLAGTSGTGNALALPAWTGSEYAAFARPTSAGTITELYFYAQGAGRGNNQIGAWSVQAATLDIGGDDHYVIQSNNALTFIAGLTFVVEVA